MIARPLSPAKVIYVSLGLFILLLMVMLFSLYKGAVNIRLVDMLNAILGKGNDPGSIRLILLKIRLPRILLAGAVGFILSLGGVVFQAILRNPLADPFILGVSSGSALGAITGIIMGLSYRTGIPTMAFCGAIFTIVLVIIIGKKGKEAETSNIILAGVIINAFFTAIIMFFIACSSNEKLHSMLSWLYGDLSQAYYAQFWIVFTVTICSFFILYLFSRHLNIITAGEEVALQLGVDVEKVKWISLIVVSLSVGLAVSFSGLIGFAGLIVPHICRMIWGSDHRILIPSASLGGAVFLIAADTFARTIIAPNELPVGVVTAAIGAPFFIYLLIHRGSRWEQF
ncbi:MAG: iron ABC transporter permease [Deltaproteobacteria bacterium]|nr:MAG: iron ABC transporter permease [Deltaproteobacteria bacterium]